MLERTMAFISRELNEINRWGIKAYMAYSKSTRKILLEGDNSFFEKQIESIKDEINVLKEAFPNVSYRTEEIYDRLDNFFWFYEHLLCFKHFYNRTIPACKIKTYFNLVKELEKQIERFDPDYNPNL